jgi:hypothetical protein
MDIIKSVTIAVIAAFVYTYITNIQPKNNVYGVRAPKSTGSDYQYAPLVGDAGYSRGRGTSSCIRKPLQIQTNANNLAADYLCCAPVYVPPVSQIVLRKPRPAGNVFEGQYPANESTFAFGIAPINTTPKRRKIHGKITCGANVNVTVPGTEVV